MSLPPDATLDDVKIKIRATTKNPNVGKVTTVALKDGPKTYKLATLFEVLEPETKQLHHYYLRLDHVTRKKDGWHARADKIITLEDENKEVYNLHRFLAAVYGAGLDGKTGDVRLVSETDYGTFQTLLSAIPNAGDTEKLALLKRVLDSLGSEATSVQDLATAFESSAPATLQNIAAASRMVEYSAACEELRRLIDTPSTSEKQLQAHLEKNPWMFGSEYSELLDRRIWTRDDQQDFMLRRTVDDYVEIIEIKRALSEPLFRYDRSHGSYYPSSNLSAVVGQVMRYIEEIERQRDNILAKDGYDTLKVRARAIVGRDHDEGHQAALRNFNAHLHRIEVITFDQLLKIAERVLSMFRDDEKTPVAEPFDFGDDIPF